MPPERITPSVAARVVGSESLSTVVRRLVVQVAARYHWRAGQHVAVRRQPSQGPDSYYSFASADKYDNPTLFELAVGQGPATIGELALGDEVYLGPAQGPALLDLFAAPQPLILVGMGTGVAPLRAVIQESVANQELRRMTLLHGCRSEEDRLFQEEFAELAERGVLDYRPVLSRGSADWTGLRGRIQAHLTPLVSDESCFMICGSKAMVDDVTTELLAAGTPRAHIHGEGY